MLLLECTSVCDLPHTHLVRGQHGKIASSQKRADIGLMNENFGFFFFSCK